MDRDAALREACSILEACAAESGATGGGDAVAGAARSGEEELQLEVSRILARADGNSGSARRARAIPRLFSKTRKRTLYTEALLEATHERFVQAKSRQLMDSTDLEELLTILRENGVPPPRGETGHPASENDLRLDYETFCALGRSLPLRVGRMFTAANFLKFRRDDQGRILISQFHDYLCRYRELCEDRIQLSVYDQAGDGSLREIDCENMVFDMLGQVQSLSSLQDDFAAFYAFTAVRRFFFFLDSRGTRKIKIKDMLASPILRELQELRSPEWDEELPHCQSNWFSAASALRVYSEYLDLDLDQNGMLSKEELGRYGNNCLTPLCVKRIWQEYRTYRNEETGEPEMDYKQFLDFVLAMEHQKAPQALQWFWKLLDVRKEGFIDRSVVKMFIQEVLSVIASTTDQAIDVDCEDVCDEIFDMAAPSDPLHVTLDDLIKCGVGDTIVSMLLDVTEFLTYDNRDSMSGHETDDGAVENVDQGQSSPVETHAGEYGELSDESSSFESETLSPTAALSRSF